MEFVEEDIRIAGCRRRRGRRRRRRRIAEALAIVQRSAAVVERTGPGKVDRLVTRPGALERLPDRGAGGFGDADIHAGHAVGRSAERRDRAFVGQEFDHRSVGCDQCDGVGRTVLDPVGRKFDRDCAETGAFVVDDKAVERDRVVGRGIRAVIKHQRIARQVEACGTGHFDEFADIGAGVIVMKLVDEDDRFGADDGLAGIRRARSAGRRGGPDEVAIGSAFAGQLERIADRRAAGFCHADVGAGETVGGSAHCCHRAFIGQEHDDIAACIDQRDPVGGAVLDAVARKVDGQKLVAARQCDRVVRRAVRAVIEHQRPAGQVDLVEIGDLDEFARVGVGVIVVEFVDEYARADICNHEMTPPKGNSATPGGSLSSRAFVRIS